MTTTLLVGLFFAIGSGLAIGGQGTLINILGQQIGPVRAGFLIHLAGAVVGGMIVGVMALAGDRFPQIEAVRPVATAVLIAGGLGMVIVPGVAVAFPRIGQVAGQAAIILGQMTIAIAIDTLGLAGTAPIPLDMRRIAGLVVMAIAAVLLLPRT